MMDRMKKIAVSLLVMMLLASLFPLMPVQAATSDAAGEIEVEEYLAGADRQDPSAVRSAINRALAEAGRQGTEKRPATVRFKAGETYVVNQILFVYPYTVIEAEGATIRGEGYSGSLLKGAHTADGQPPVSWGSNRCVNEMAATGCRHGGYSQAHDIRVHGGTWIAPSADDSDLNAQIVLFQHASHITFDGMKLAGNTNHAMNLAGSEEIQVLNCSFSDPVYYTGVGTIIAEANYLEAIHLDFCNKAGEPNSSPQDNTPCRNILVKGCTFNGTYAGVGCHKANDIPAENITVTGNTFRNLRYGREDGTYGNAVNFMCVKGLTITNNTMEGVYSLANLNKEAKGVNIKGNTLRNVRGEGLILNDGATGTVADNDFAIKGAGRTGNGANGIFINGNSVITVSGNTISGATARGITVLESRAVLKNNTIQRAATDGIMMKDPLTGSSVVGNIVQNPGKVGMNILGSANLQIKNNEVTGCGGNAIQLTKGAANTFSATITGNHAVQNLGGKDYFIGKEATKATIASFKDNCSGYPATTRFYFGTGDKLPAGNGACIKLARVTGVTSREYTGKAITPKPVVVLGTTLIEGTDYTLSYRDNVQVGTATVTITGKGQFHDSTSVKFKITEATVQDLSKATVTVADQSFDGKAKTPAPTVKLNGKVLQARTDYTVKYSDNTDPGKAKLTITGKGIYKGTVTKTFTITKPKGSFVRIAGKNRYATAYDIGNQLKLDMKVIKYDNIVVADGRNYPDALAASYLAKVKKAPIVLTAPGVFDDTVAFIRKNMKTGGTVYIAGGPGSVPQEFVNKLAGIKVKRLGGANRYETNLLILKEAAVKNQDIIVCTGADFGDSLSAGATGRPILLAAGSSLTNSQKTYLNGLTTKKYYVIGGADVVSNGVQADLAKYGSVTRITGKDVFTRSVSIAKTFFPGNQPHIGLASGESYPDGLCGDPLAMAKGGPLLLAGSQKHMYSPAAAYAKAANTYQVTVFGGAVWVSDQAVRAVLGQ